MLDAEEPLVRRILNGDDQAFRIIVEKYQSLVLAICRNIVNDYHEAENLAQETFFQAYNSLPQYQYKGFKTWLCRIATNKSIDFKRKTSKTLKSQVVYLDEINDSESLQVNDVEEKLISKENSEKIILICKQIPEKYGNILIDYYINSQSYQQISIKEGISIRAVESRLYRAKKFFKSKWEEEEYEAL
ncbi:MAG: RNA polymerase sigma factor [Ignavibacteriales bacterium]